MRSILLCVLLATGCSGTTPAKPTEPTPTAKTTEPPPAQPGAAQPGAAGPARPANVSADLERALDNWAAAEEKLATELAAAGTDCKRAADRMAAYAGSDGPYAALGKFNLFDPDPAFQQWKTARYDARLKAAVAKWASTADACEDDRAFREGLTKLGDAVQPR